MALTNLNTDSNSELIDLLLKMLSASHHLQNKIQISLPSFQGFPPSVPNLPFCGYFLQLSPGKLYPVKLKLSVLSIHRWYFLSSIFSYNPVYLNVPPDIWMSKSHFSGLLKSSILPFPFSTMYSFWVQYPKTLPLNWILRKNQAPFPTSGMSLGSFQPLCKLVHPSHR